MRNLETRSVDRASRSLALALPFASLLGIPKRTVVGVKRISGRAIERGRMTVVRLATTARDRRIAPVDRSLHSSIVVVAAVDEEFEGAVNLAAIERERARCARIVRRGIDLDVAPFAAALAFHTDLSAEAAMERVEALAFIHQ